MIPLRRISAQIDGRDNEDHSGEKKHVGLLLDFGDICQHSWRSSNVS